MNNNDITRYTRIGEWVFEVKLVRALKVKNYGDPYSSCATMTITGNDLYIDSQMTRDGAEFDRKDFLTFYKFCQQMEVQNACYDRIINGERSARKVEIIQNDQIKPIVQLGKVS